MEMLSCPHAPVVVGPNHNRPWGLLPTRGAACAGGTLAVWAQCLLPTRCPFLLAPVPPLSRALTVQFHAQLGASALHLPPWGHRLLPGSRPPSMEGGSSAGSPRAAQPEQRAGGQEHPRHGTPRLSGSRPAAQPRQRDFLLCRC